MSALSEQVADTLCRSSSAILGGVVAVPGATTTKRHCLRSRVTRIQIFGVFVSAPSFLRFHLAPKAASLCIGQKSMNPLLLLLILAGAQVSMARVFWFSGYACDDATCCIFSPFHSFPPSLCIRNTSHDRPCL